MAWAGTVLDGMTCASKGRCWGFGAGLLRLVEREVLARMGAPQGVFVVTPLQADGPPAFRFHFPMGAHIVGTIPTRNQSTTGCCCQSRWTRLDIEPQAGRGWWRAEAIFGLGAPRNVLTGMAVMINVLAASINDAPRLSAYVAIIRSDAQPSFGKRKLPISEAAGFHAYSTRDTKTGACMYAVAARRSHPRHSHPSHAHAHCSA